MAVIAGVGALVGALGMVLIGPLQSAPDRLMWTALVYGLLGLFGLYLGLGQFGLWPTPSFALPWGIPAFVHGQPHVRRALVLGAAVGGGLGIGCPFPTYHVLLAWIAATGDPWLGALTLAINGVGRAFPLMIVGALVFAGVGRRDIAGWVVAHRPAMRLINALSLTFFGAFMLAFWVLAFPLVQGVWG